MISYAGTNSRHDRLHFVVQIFYTYVVKKQAYFCGIRFISGHFKNRCLYIVVYIKEIVDFQTYSKRYDD